MSMLPPFFRGGIVLCPPGSGSPVPITPGNGSSGTATPCLPMRANRPSETSQICRKGLSKSLSGRSPRPGRIAVQPNGARGRTSWISTTRTSPGCAPRTRTGPVSGWPRNGPRAITSAWVDAGL